MDPLNEAQRRIRAAFESHIAMTTAQGNRIGRTVDFRKIVSRLRRSGMEIESYWNERDGRRYKTYYYQRPLPGKGSKMENFGEPKMDLNG